MDLIWKDHEHTALPTTCCTNQARGLAASDTRDQPSPVDNVRNKPVRFVPGRFKSRRKPNRRRSKPATFSIATARPTSKEASPSRKEALAAEEQHECDALTLGLHFSEPAISTEASQFNVFDTLPRPVNLSWSDDYGLNSTNTVSGCSTASSPFASSFHSGIVLPGDNESNEETAISRETRGDSDSEGLGPEVELHALQLLHRQPGFHMIMFQNVAQKFRDVLSIYNDDFCILPLSMDCDSNPFRVSNRQCEANPSLLHSVLALSFQHLAKQSNSPNLVEETDRHRSMAVQCYSDALGSSTATILLDTLLLLFNFEVTQSAFGGWKVHIRGAKKILDGMNISHALRTNSRIRAQVATLVWWDITLAFIAREECTMPLHYLDLLVEYNHQDEWTFFMLNGCPAALMTAMGKLARLASIYEQAAKLEWTTFNTHPVDVIVGHVLHFKNDDSVSPEELKESDEDPLARQDRYHCVEAWRNAIILYTWRVFQAEQDKRRLLAIDHFSRVILDHIRCIRQTATVQKQVLLPLFLAAAELGDEHPDREFVRSYCKHWSATARYSQFESALSWLEIIWADWQISSRSTYWWGCKVGAEAWGMGEGVSASIGPELLLG